MADSFNKKEREKRKRKRKQEKAEKRKNKKLDGPKPVEFMYVDENGNLSSTPPDLSKREEIKLEDINISTPRQEEDDNPIKVGIVKFFNSEKHFGFIKELKTGHEYFVHGDNVNGELKENNKVEFEIGMGNKGPIAVNVELKK